MPRFNDTKAGNGPVIPKKSERVGFATPDPAQITGSAGPVPKSRAQIVSGAIGHTGSPGRCDLSLRVYAMGDWAVAIFAVALLAVTAVAAWLCRPTKDGEVRAFLRGPMDTIAAAAITAGFGLGAVMLIAAMAQSDLLIAQG